MSSGGRTVGTYSLKSGVRSVKVSRGRLFLNGRPVNFRGVGVHEDTRTQGFAVDDAFRERLVSEAQGASARPCCARTTRCTPTSTSSPTARGC